MFSRGGMGVEAKTEMWLARAHGRRQEKEEEDRMGKTRVGGITRARTEETNGFSIEGRGSRAKGLCARC